MKYLINLNLFALALLVCGLSFAKPILEESALPASLQAFWQDFALEYHSHEGRAVFIQAQCWPSDTGFCVLHYAEPLPSGWDSYLAVVKPNATEPVSELSWGKYERLLGYQFVFGTLYASVVSTQVFNTSEPQRITLYQFKDNQFISLSETQSLLNNENTEQKPMVH